MIRRRRSRRAYTLAEVIISGLIVSTMLVAALEATLMCQHGREELNDHARAVALADDLLSEILTCAYQDPNQATVFGRESGEGATTRADFDDVDDYNGWSAAPPERRDGTPLFDDDTWRRVVTVAYVPPTDLNAGWDPNGRTLGTGTLDGEAQTASTIMGGSTTMTFTGVGSATAGEEVTAGTLDSGFKRIVVAVYNDDRLLYQVVAVRTVAWPLNAE